MRTALVVGLGLLGGCVPNDHPPWLVDHPLPWGIVASVVEPGGYSSEVVVPDDRVRASALPLDTLELQWITAVPPGVTVPPPIWFVCPGRCSSLPAEPIPACAFPLPLSRSEHCRLGEGERVRLSLGGAYTANEYFRGFIGVMGITSDGTVEPETCLQRYRTVPRAGLEHCLLQERLLQLGPESRLLTTVPGLADFYTVEGGLPDDLDDEAPDVHPTLSGLRVAHSGRGGLRELIAQPGDTITVRVGAYVFVEPQYTADAYQPHYAFQSMPGQPERLVAAPDEERIFERYGLSTLIEDRGDPNDDLLGFWQVPDVPEPILFYLYIADSRQGRAFATLRFVVEDASPAP
ncbi:hypothetical protein OV090_33315 [Nannocystis sp. RBIL2]|uniref:hypothetical protein n=1 Tax=Nannocystis sp. RBIL2 TaxID=2996788 RepID=UPI00226E5BB6|nr:hypothetical protein [Nannocystis sp. RBIL2]MCY1069669.1 hypothetical protein [Nannocystis sp. RBIL2]